MLIAKEKQEIYDRVYEVFEVSKCIDCVENF